MKPVEKSMSLVLLSFNLIGLGHVPRTSFVKWASYKLYVLIMTGFAIFKIFVMTDEYTTSSSFVVWMITNEINYYCTRFGTAIFYLETLFNSKDLKLILRSFSKIDEILLENFDLTVNYRKIKRLHVLVLITFAANSFVYGFFIRNGSVTNIVMRINTQIINLIVTFTFTSLTLNIIYRLKLLVSYYRLKRTNNANESEAVILVFREICEIVERINKYFLLKFCCIAGK